MAVPDVRVACAVMFWMRLSVGVVGRMRRSSPWFARWVVTALRCRRSRSAPVTQVAQRHDIRRQQIHAWRHVLRKRGLCAPEGAALFLPAKLAPPQVSGVKPAAAIVAPMVKIVLRNGRQIRCRGGIGDDDLARLIRLFEAA